MSSSIFVSACVALYATVLRFINPQHLTHLWVLAAAGVIGFVGNEIAAQVRLRAGHRLASAAMTADGNHARVDGFVSLSVVASAIFVGLGLQIADPIIGLIITTVILEITWDSWRTVRAAKIDIDYVEDEDEPGRRVTNLRPSCSVREGLFGHLAPTRSGSRRHSLARR